MFLIKLLKQSYGKCRISRMKKHVVNLHHDILDYKLENVSDMRKYGFSMSESSLYNLNEKNYKDYISTWEAFQPRILDSKYFAISDDKYLFSLVFGQYVKVAETFALINNGKILSLCPRLNPEKLYEFIIKNNGAVIKDRCGCDGFDVYVFNVINKQVYYKSNLIDEDRLIEIVSSFKNGIIQDKLVQGDFENKIFDKSINTIRIISMRKKGEAKHEIVAALQRIGNNQSAPVDNFNQGGYSALIDLETGELGTATGMMAVDENGHRIFYENHPDTNSQIKGLKIPNWIEIKNTICELTEKIPFFEFIAWDIVVLNDGMAVIETNMKSSLNVFQIHGGLRNKNLGKKFKEHGYITE